MTDEIVEIKDEKYGTFHINKIKMHLFWYFIWERMNVWHKRFMLKQERPWTDDEIIDQYSFTNVYRELDKTTIWYHKYIGNKKVKSKKDIVFATFIHRLFNNIENMEKIMHLIDVETFDEQKMFEVLNKERQSGKNIWCTAHMTTGVRFKGSDDRLENIIYLIKLIHDQINPIYKSIKNSSSLEDLYNNVRKVNGFGPFLGYQYILDMVNSGVANYDLDSFVVAGPGCKRGIRLIFPDSSALSLEQSMQYLRENQQYYFDMYNYNFKYCKALGGKERGIHVGNIENCLCEFSKYHRTWIGGRAPKNKYRDEYNKTKQLTLELKNAHQL